MNYYIGVDLGTSSMKMMLVNADGEICKSVTEEYKVFYPQSGWSEQNAEDWWQALIKGMKVLTDNLDSELIKGIGVAGQMHGLVVLDNEDKIIRPTILWNDGRTQKQTDYLNEIIGKDKLSDYTANIAFAGFTAPKLLWMKENEPENFGKISKIMLPKDYINYCLTGVHCTDYSDASGILALDVKNKCWSKEMLSICSVTEEQMPKLYESYEVVGKILPSVAELLNLNSETVVVAGAGDNAAAAIGTGTVGEGKCNVSLGTSGTAFISSDKFSLPEENSLHSFCHADAGFHLMGCILSAASCNKWLCDEIFKSNDYKTLEGNIKDDKLGKNELYFLPYLMGERSPINDTDATGMFIGLRPYTTREDMHQAVLEGVAFAIRDNLEVAKKLGIKIEESCLCGGGGKSKLWQKILCNILDIRLKIPTFEEGPGFGAVLLAMVGAQEYPDLNSAIEKFVSFKDTVEPDKTLVKLYEERYQKYRKIYPAVKHLYKEIKE